MSLLAGVTGASSHFWTPPLQAGVGSLPTNQGTLYPDINVDIEPDADADVFGDESQDQCPGVAGPENGCPPQPQPQPQTGDSTAPNAQITEGPKDKTKKKTATFEFSGTDARAIAVFQCSLDGDAFAPCTSPHTVRVKKGKHTFSVRAVDDSGNVGTPASDSWKRKKKREKKYGGTPR